MMHCAELWNFILFDILAYIQCYLFIVSNSGLLFSYRRTSQLFNVLARNLSSLVTGSPNFTFTHNLWVKVKLGKPVSHSWKKNTSPAVTLNSVRVNSARRRRSRNEHRDSGYTWVIRRRLVAAAGAEKRRGTAADAEPRSDHRRPRRPTHVSASPAHEPAAAAAATTDTHARTVLHSDVTPNWRQCT